MIFGGDEALLAFKRKKNRIIKGDNKLSTKFKHLKCHADYVL